MADLQIPAEMIIGGFVAMGGAVAWLAHKWDAGNNRCEERGNSLQAELRSLRDWTQTHMLEALQANTSALRQLKHEVRELDPSDVQADSESDLHKSVHNGYERRVLERSDAGETTAIIRRVK